MKKLSSILLVDDDATTNYLNERLLYKLGVTDQCLVAGNGAEALRLLAQLCFDSDTANCPALILLDVNMPLMNGIEFLEAYQPPYPAAQLVIVILTSSTHAHDLARLQGLPVASLVSKPLTREKVDLIMQQHFQRHLSAN
jgi:CheY-like chemotaxis protein